MIALNSIVLPEVALERVLRVLPDFLVPLAWNESAAHAAGRKTWFAGRARAAAVSPEQVAACPAAQLGGCFCRLPALPLEAPLEQH